MTRWNIWQGRRRDGGGYVCSYVGTIENDDDLAKVEGLVKARCGENYILRRAADDDWYRPVKA